MSTPPKKKDSEASLFFLQKNKSTMVLNVIFTGHRGHVFRTYWVYCRFLHHRGVFSTAFANSQDWLGKRCLPCHLSYFNHRHHPMDPIRYLSRCSISHIHKCHKPVRHVLRLPSQSSRRMQKETTSCLKDSKKAFLLTGFCRNRLLMAYRSPLRNNRGLFKLLHWF